MDAYRRLTSAAVGLLLALPAMATSTSPPQATSVTVEKIDLNRPILWPPEPGSGRQQALAALDGATGWTLYSLQPWFYEPSAGEPGSEVEASRSVRHEDDFTRSQAQWCRDEACFYDTRVLGRVELDGRDRAEAESAVRETLKLVPDYASSCAPEYRHAIAFANGGKRYELLLCYQCGQFQLMVDGEIRDSGQAISMGDLGALNAIFVREGIALARRSW